MVSHGIHTHTLRDELRFLTEYTHPHTERRTMVYHGMNTHTKKRISAWALTRIKAVKKNILPNVDRLGNIEYKSTYLPGQTNPKVGKRCQYIGLIIYSTNNPVSCITQDWAKFSPQKLVYNPLYYTIKIPVCSRHEKPLWMLIWSLKEKHKHRTM